MAKMDRASKGNGAREGVGEGAGERERSKQSLGRLSFV